MKAIKKFAVCSVLVAMSLSVVGCSGNNSESKQEAVISEEKGNVIATVNGEPIYQSDYDDLYNEYYTYFGGTDEAIEYLNDKSNLLVDELVNTKVLMQKAEELDITCTDKEVQETYDEVKAQYGDETFNQMLEYSGITKDEYLTELKRQLILLKLQEVMLKDSKEVTDGQIQAYYNEHKDEYKVGAGADMRHILVRVTEPENEEEMKKVDAAVKEIQSEFAAGATFDELAEKYSADDVEQDFYIVEDLGFIEYDSPYLDEDFLVGAKALKDGEVSGPVKSSFGYHFITVDNITGETITPLEDVKEEIKSTLQQEVDYAQYQDVLNKWVSEADVEKFEDKIEVPEFIVEIQEAKKAEEGNANASESTENSDTTSNVETNNAHEETTNNTQDQVTTEATN